MLELFYRGGPLFMSVITLFGFIGFLYLARMTRQVVDGNPISSPNRRNMFIAGAAALVSGFLFQVVGLVRAFDAIAEAGDVSPSVVSEAMTGSMIAPFYGLLVFLFLLAGYLILHFVQSPGEGEA